VAESSGIRLDLYRGRGWIVIFRGLVAIAFGVLAFAWANASLRRLALLFGIYAVLHAFLSIIAAVGKRGEPGCGLLGTEAIVGFFAGAITFVTRSASAKAVVFFIWLWAIATGMLRIAEGIQMRKHRPGSVWLILSGLAATFLGVLLLLRVPIRIFAPASTIGVFALLCGLFEVLVGWGSKRRQRQEPHVN